MFLYLNSLSKFFLLICLLTSLFLISSCRDDDDNGGVPLTYNATEHIYGMTYASFSSSDWWQVVINPQTGAYDTVPGTKRSDVLSFPSGTRSLFDFTNNRSVYWSGIDSRLIVQNVETLESIIIEVKDSVAGSSILNPQFFTFGATNDLIYIFDADKSLWLVDLSTNTVEVLYEDLLFGDFSPDNQLYLGSTNQLIYGGHIGASNFYVSTVMFTLDLDTGEISTLGDVPASFGWVLDTQTERIYGLTTSTDDQGFRLIQFQISGNDVQSQIMSPEDLPIDNLSFHAQTIHTGTSTYICRGGSGQEGMLSNDIYSIDLSTGEFDRTISLNEIGGDQVTVIDLYGE